MRSSAEVFGATLAVVASVISNIGVNIQKYSHADNSRLPEIDQRFYIQRPLWWVGFMLVVVGVVGDFTAFGFATQSLVAALGGGATLVTNVLAAYFMNKETLYMTDMSGVCFVIVGVLIIAWIAEPNVEYPLPELEQRFARPGFVVYIAIVGILIVGMLATIKGSVANRLTNQLQSSRLKQKQLMKQLESRIQKIELRLGTMERRLDQHQDIASGSSSAACDVDAGHADPNNAKKALANQPPSRVPVYYAVCSGIIGSISVLLAKCSAVMIRLSLQGKNQFDHPETYLFIGGMFISMVVQTHFLNVASSLGDIMVVYPIFQACWISFSVIGGAVFYESEKSFTPQKWALYPLALLSIAVGVGLLVQHKSSTGITKTGCKSKEFGLLADDEVCLITDSSMRSPLLTDEDEVDACGYLHLDANA